MKITVLGAGAWGTALARLLIQGDHQVTLWGHVADWLDEIRQAGRNERFLPGIDLPRQLLLQSDLPRAIAGAECIVVAVPSQPFRQVTSQLAGFSGPIVSVTKGIEYDTGLTMCGVLAQTAPHARSCADAGPEPYARSSCSCSCADARPEPHARAHGERDAASHLRA